MKKSTRDQPLKGNTREDFMKYIKKREFFSEVEVVEGEKVTPVERFKMELE